ncbi:Fe2+-dependent dioxygenase [Pelagibius sp. Alg239-R121]|uniref:Fe2+-dependent dioxygenase n=1 Tax=Pelagibius sp. Alg239-R121 TaxID=2993448 RepID=UPI0024A78C01|nr:Fe2+-dependent dioxygenase [Pelagibius sp. Alg239-R121]
MFIILSGVLSRHEVEQVLALAAQGAFQDGKKTAGGPIRHLKNNLQLDKSGSAAQEIDRIILGKLARNREFSNATLAKRILSPIISRYETGMAYGQHVDSDIVGSQNPVRADLSLTIFLADPGSYDGGELVLSTPFGEQMVKLPAGDAVIYTTSAPHRVATVERGVRIAAVSWIQSVIRDDAKRQIILDVQTAMERVMKENPDSEEARLMFKTRANLMRMWAEH